MNLIEKLIVKLFRRTFKKVYEMGLTDSFNFCNSSSFTPQKKIYKNTSIAVKSTKDNGKVAIYQ